MCLYSVAPISVGGPLSTGNSVKLIKFHHQKRFIKTRAFLNLTGLNIVSRAEPFPQETNASYCQSDTFNDYSKQFDFPPTFVFIFFSIPLIVFIQVGGLENRILI